MRLFAGLLLTVFFATATSAASFGLDDPAARAKVKRECLALETIVTSRRGNSYTQSGAVRQRLSRCFGRAGDADSMVRYFKSALSRWAEEGKLKSFLAYKYEELADLFENLNRLRDAWDARRYADDLRSAR